ncbi:MAG TPA: RNA-binding protein hfq [Cyanothece sp. UBA12306]|nr:RNA-binding protein hfq [Cyanothece sp. UBA12306]
MDEFNTGLPSTRLVQTWIKDKQKVEVKLSTDQIVEGTIMWQDVQSVYITDDSGQSTLIWRQALVYLKPKG